MDSPLHKSPIGLMDLLGLRVQGQNPSLFGDRVTPIIDASALYTADQIRSTSNASAGEVAASSITLQVDNAYVWLLRAITARWDYVALTTTADEQWRWSVQYLPAGSASTPFIFGFEDLALPITALALPLGAAATYSRVVTRVFDRPFLLMPGTILQASASSACTVGSYSSSLRADFVALRT